MLSTFAANASRAAWSPTVFHPSSSSGTVVMLPTSESDMQSSLCLEGVTVCITPRRPRPTPRPLPLPRPCVLALLCDVVLLAGDDVTPGRLKPGANAPGGGDCDCSL